MAKIKTHRKLENGSYLIEIQTSDELRRFEFPALSDLNASEYEQQQLEEVKALLDAESARKGKKLKSEGTTL